MTIAVNQSLFEAIEVITAEPVVEKPSARDILDHLFGAQDALDKLEAALNKDTTTLTASQRSALAYFITYNIADFYNVGVDHLPDEDAVERIGSLAFLAQQVNARVA